MQQYSCKNIFLIFPMNRNKKMQKNLAGGWIVLLFLYIHDINGVLKGLSPELDWTFDDIIR
jgi:hypothetical protein